MMESGKLAPRFEERDAIVVTGLPWRGSAGPAELPAHWDRFLPMLPALLEHSPTGRTFGVERDYDPATGEFSYLAGVEVTPNSPVPTGLEQWEIPAARWAVFPVRLPEIPSTYEAVVREYLPTSEWQLAFDVTYEDYGVDFDGENLELCFPVIPRS